MRFGVFFLFLLQSFTAFTQQLQFSNISSNLSLPSQECYNIMQDSKGYIWFSSEAGLCKFNGNDLEVFDKRNGLPEGSTYSVTEDKTGTLWFATSKNRILKYSNSSLIEAAFSKKHEAALKGSLELSYLLSFDEKGLLHINTGTRSYKVHIINNEITEHFKPDTSVHFYLLKTSNGLIPINGGKGQGINSSTKKASKGYVRISIGGLEKEIQIPFDKNQYPYWRILTAHALNTDFFCFENFVVKMNADGSHTVYEYPDRVLQIYSDKNNGFWVGIRKNGVYYYPDISDMGNKIISLNEYSVTGISEDNEKGVWCSTLEKGIFYCKNKTVVTYVNVNGLNKRAHFLKYEGGFILTASQDNELCLFSKKGIETKQFEGNENFIITDVLQTDKTWLVGSKTYLFKTDETFKTVDTIKLGKTQFNAGAYQIANTENERQFVIQYSVISELINNEAVKRTTEGLGSAGTCLLYLGNNKLLAGCKTGLYQMDINTYVLKEIKDFTAEVTKIIKTSEGEVWITTKNDGLYLYKNESVINKTTEYKLNNIRLFDIAEDKKNRVWLASNIGLICINSDKSVSIYNQMNGLSSNEVNKVAISNDELYFSTNEGISCFPLNTSLENSTKPYIYLNNLKVNDRTIKYSGDFLTLKPDENSLSLYFDLLTFKGNQTKMLYLLEGVNGTTGIVESNKLILNNLYPGTYKLSVYAINNSKRLSKTPFVISFVIIKPFWATTWFILLCIALISLIIYLIVRIIIKRIRSKEEEKTKINKLIAEHQLSALQAQMNPHFIFNAINSIQGYILKKNEQQAYDYLAKFSKLIRMVLNHSLEKILPLKQELEMLNLYVELEQLRFEKSFDFELIVDKNISQYETQVPSMLIQPYVENAIWHGLMNLPTGQAGLEKNKKGKLKVEIKLLNNLLNIIIEDNGVGRALSSTFKKESNHQSVGMKLTEKRLVMINKLQEYEGAKVIVIDLYDELKNASGTRVEISIPIN